MPTSRSTDIDRLIRLQSKPYLAKYLIHLSPFATDSFPAQIPLGARSVAWVESEVQLEEITNRAPPTAMENRRWLLMKAEFNPVKRLLQRPTHPNAIKAMCARWGVRTQLAGFQESIRDCGAGSPM